MKILKKINLGASIAVIIVIFLFSACSKKVKFSSSTIVPAAQGIVKIKKDANKNSSIDIRIKNLAEPNRLEIGKTVYVVWMLTDQNGVKNIGRLISSKSLFSSLLQARLTTITPFSPIQIFITAEENSDTPYPGSYLILETKKF
jgi:hypothetical protein